MPLYPITFSIPEHKIITSLPEKKRIMSALVPGYLKSYIYKTEDEYYTQYKESMFAITVKKGGWDCMRHYEIMAAGCVPIFYGIEQCPEMTCTTLPKEELLAVNGLITEHGGLEWFRDTDAGQSVYYELQSRIFDFINNVISAKSS